MFVQIDIWCSKELATWLMKNNHDNTWLSNLKENDKEGYDLARRVEPVRIDSRTAAQTGSLLPKLLHFYEVPDRFRVAEPLSTNVLKQSIMEILELIYFSDDNDGFRDRALERDNLEVYPYLSHDSKDYFTTHNMEISSMVNPETLLRLFRLQLDNFDSGHMYMSQLRAYDPSFDTCYQYIDVRSPSDLKEPPTSKPEVVQSSWLGCRELGYSTSSIDLDVVDQDFVTVSAAHKAVQDGIIDAALLSTSQLRQQIQWFEPFKGMYYSISYDLFGKFYGWTLDLCRNDSVVEVEFNWYANEKIH
ncbi:MAG: hypothetical protein HRU38_10820 [Saccharospirillaceae bacterium]|nr:hypothetical protein [Saccharospirillaceae bacterium]